MFKRKKVWKWLAISVVSILAIILVGNVIARKMIQKKFDASLNQLQPFIVAKYKDININLVTGSFVVDSLSVQYQPDSTKPEYQHTFLFASVTINGINYFNLISGKTFSASELHLDNCAVLLNSELLEKTDTTAKKLLSQIKIPFQNITFRELRVTNASVKKTGTKNDIINDLNLTITGISLNNADSFSLKNDLQFSKVEGELNNVNYALQGYHTLHISKISLNSEDSILKIDSLKLIPQLSKLELGRKLGHQADCISSTVPSVTLTGLDFKQLQQNKIIADKMKLNDAVVYIFRDRRLPRQMKDQPMTAEYLKQIPFDIFINVFDLSNITATSEEFPRDGEKTGYIKITGINVNMRPFFNKPNSEHSTLKATVKGSIMSAGIIHADIELSLQSGIEHVNGAIDELHLAALNPSAENLGKFHIESGVLNRLDFAFSASDKKASGKIVGVYHDLVVDKLKETKDGKLKKASLPSFALKTFIIPKNKDVSMPVEKRTGKIDFERDPTRFITFYYIKSLLDGIRNSFSLGFLLPQ